MARLQNEWQVFSWQQPALRLLGGPRRGAGLFHSARNDKRMSMKSIEYENLWQKRPKSGMSPHERARSRTDRNKKTDVGLMKCALKFHRKFCTDFEIFYWEYIYNCMKARFFVEKNYVRLLGFSDEVTNELLPSTPCLNFLVRRMALYKFRSLSFILISPHYWNRYKKLRPK